jgi:hypothetical protein
MEDQNLMCQTHAPLHGFRSDVEKITLSDGIEIAKYDEEKFEAQFPKESVCLNYFRLFQPDFVIIQQPKPGTMDISGEHVNVTISLEARQTTDRLVTTLRLFKPGTIRKGVVWVVGRQPDGHIPWEITLHEPGLHFGSLQKSPDQWYELLSSEVTTFANFRGQLLPILEKLENYPQLMIATTYFEQSFEAKENRHELIDLCIAMESLFLQDEDGLSFRLALRAANLLGVDAAERAAIFKKVKDYYDVRSKVVHGDVLKSKHLAVLNNVVSLRDIVRCSLLSVFALLSGPGHGRDFFRQVDALNLDDEARKTFQGAASRFLGLVPRIPLSSSDAQ